MRTSTTEISHCANASATEPIVLIAACIPVFNLFSSPAIRFDDVCGKPQIKFDSIGSKQTPALMIDLSTITSVYSFAVLSTPIPLSAVSAFG